MPSVDIKPAELFVMVIVGVLVGDVTTPKSKGLPTLAVGSFVKLVVVTAGPPPLKVNVPPLLKSSL